MDTYYFKKIIEHFYVVKLVFSDNKTGNDDNDDNNNTNNENVIKYLDLPKDVSDDERKVFDIFDNFFHIQYFSKEYKLNKFNKTTEDTKIQEDYKTKNHKNNLDYS